MKATNTRDPEYFHKVVDCQYACPAHTPVPEYIRLIAAQRYTDAYMINWESNVFPGVLGRTCDRPCEPACRRGRIDDEPVAICRLKRVAADNKGDISDRMPIIPKKKNGKRIALIGAGPAALTVARDLMPLGYSVDLYDDQRAGGGFMRSQIPAFRLPEEVLNDEVDRILDMGVLTHFNHYVDSLKTVLDKNYDAVFVGSGAPRGRDLDLPGRVEADANIHIGIDWLSSVAFEHVESIGKKVIVLGGGNTAMDCCRTARRVGGDEVKVIVRSPFAEMKASPWEKEDAAHEGIPIMDNHVPQEFIVEDGRLVAMRFDRVKAVYDNKGKRSLVSTGEEPVIVACDDVLVAIGQENSFPWIERDVGVEFDKWGMPVVDETTFQSSNPTVFFGGDAAFGPQNVITAVAHGHQAAISIDLHCQGESVAKRPPPGVTLVSQKMGIHEWSYDSQIENDERYQVPQAELEQTLTNRKLEVELGYDAATAFQEAQRCLNCDAQTVFTEQLCIECDACVDICPTDCLSIVVNSADEDQLRQTLKMPANNTEQDIYVSADLRTGRAMIKDENVCLHCGLCAERCPTAAWDMQKFYYSVSKAGQCG
ncbi:FAD-dependent oxidoreductase [Zhongshania aliphaticivorans]|uniref:FAD-dependent oxidoreductase n=1 Tax=Zhongshania aliphaticivorans TaxID=1470434 RepID=UPI0012E45A6A|nr:FAD-dependent oxidoreductase [Zhongshania aliphaticivorans]MBQ0761093.1 FAD-dependent oxidoreductase [Zhongshania sp.]CAA0093017.1 NADPH-Fe(3+) oxidoreductase subunit beta [Zhongshania aliphaticivorans]